MALKSSYLEALSVLQQFCDDAQHFELTEKIATQLATCFSQGGKILACGNGGSACDAMHLCEEFTGRYRHNRKALPAIAICDPSHITCVANDFGFEQIFSRAVEAHGNKGDWLFVLSTSGHSENIIRAVAAAQSQELTTVALLGGDGGKLQGQCDYQFIVPAKTSDRIQEIHMMILHIIIEGVERQLFPENYDV